MMSTFDAYDLMRRSLLSSIMGLKRKDRVQHSSDHSSPGLISSPSLHRPIQQPEIEKTPHDIYREIVVECAQIERSGMANTLAEFNSSASVLPSAPLSLLDSPYPICSSFIKDTLPQSHSLLMTNVHCREEPAEVNSPPPYSLFPPVLNDNHASTSIKEPLLPVEQSVMLFSVKREDGVDAISVEELVKLVVSAMKNSGLSEVEKESPEDVLRRKRQQNNKAAARYRKRQREARNVAEGELDQLLRRNENLRQTVERMQLEIDELKRAVLNGSTSQHLSLP